jgi:hypothetical protein
MAAFSAQCLSALDTADDAPTTQQVSPCSENSIKRCEEQLSTWAELKEKAIPPLNDQLKKARQPVIDFEQPVPAAAGAAQATSQERDKNEE